MKQKSKALRLFWDALARDGCCICGGPAEIAHCHGGSIVERLQEPKAKGKKLAYLDWIVLPLCPNHHRLGPAALDLNRDDLEAVYGTQADWVDRMRERTGVDAWAKCNAMRKTKPAIPAAVWSSERPTT